MRVVTNGWCPAWAGVGAGGDAVVDGGAEELLETVAGFEVEGRVLVEEVPHYLAISTSGRSEFDPGWTEVRRCLASSSIRSADRRSGAP